MDTLERKYETIQDERNTWMKKCEELEMQNRELQKQLTELQSQIIDFDEMVSPNPNFNIKTIDAPIETGKAILEIPNPFEIDVINLLGSFDSISFFILYAGIDEI
eukprot:TRINITY_DN34528_c0_g1_i1.p3 TRINITY_DN34528_c0_g1~~TRINITY_DN34528_c0_g1_i1.p3  ORF type:complete len:105 (-),score=17.78 TRINITY_DN34528_c0_g1_i1:51-365(-)